MMSGVCFRIKQVACVGVLVAWREIDERRLAMWKAGDGYIRIHHSFLEICFSIKIGGRWCGSLRLSGNIVIITMYRLPDAVLVCREHHLR